MEEIEKRLRDTTDACIKSFENWIKQGKDLESRETLMEAMHEIRKVVARLEVEIAISERDRLGSRPLPIPPHRSSRKGPQGEDGDYGDDDMMQQPHAPQPHRAQGGGQNNDQRRGGGQNRGRRPMGLRSQGGNNGNNDGGNGNNDSQPQ